MDLEKAYDRMLRDELCFCIREFGAAERYVRTVQDMYESCMTVVRCPVRVMNCFKLEVGLLQRIGSVPPYAEVMDRLTDEVRQESLWTVCR